MLWSTAAALASAVLFAFTTNLQRVAASAVPAEGSGPLQLVRGLIGDVRWLLGGLIGCLALGLHMLALAGAGVLAVQSVMALGLVITLYVEATRERRRLRPNELAGATLVVAGVLAVVGISRTEDRPGAGGGWVLAVCAAVIAGALGAVLRSRRGVGSRWEARLLAAAGGACFAVDAVFLQRAVALVGGGFDPASAALDAAGFLAASLIGGVAVHRAYQVAPLRSVQPFLVATEPVTAALIGLGVLHAGPRAGVVGYLVLGGALLAITSGIFVSGVPTGTPDEAAETVPVVPLQHDRIAVHDDIEDQQPGHGVRPAAHRGVAAEQQARHERDHMPGLGVPHRRVQVRQGARVPLHRQPQGGVEHRERAATQQSLGHPYAEAFVEPPAALRVLDRVIPRRQADRDHPAGDPHPGHDQPRQQEHEAGTAPSERLP